MGDDERRAPLQELDERSLQARFGIAIDARRRLVEDQNRCVTVECARESDELALARRKVLTALAHLGVETSRSGRQEIESADAVEHGANSLAIRLAARRHVFGD